MLGTVVSQTFLNIIALIVLGAVMFSSVDLFSGHEHVLLFAAIAPAALLAAVLVAPLLLRHGAVGTRSSRVAAALASARRAIHSEPGVSVSPWARRESISARSSR